MPYFQITMLKGRKSLGTVEADDIPAALDVFAVKSGFWDFQDLASSMEMTEERARAGLMVRETAALAYDALSAPAPVPEYVVP